MINSDHLLQCVHMRLIVHIRKENSKRRIWLFNKYLFLISDYTSTLPSWELGQEQKIVWQNRKPCYQTTVHSFPVGTSMGAPPRQWCCAYSRWVTIYIYKVIKYLNLTNWLQLIRILSLYMEYRSTYVFLLFIPIWTNSY